jgi:hypothetical protein
MNAASAVACSWLEGVHTSEWPGAATVLRQQKRPRRLSVRIEHQHAKTSGVGDPRTVSGRRDQRSRRSILEWTSANRANPRDGTARPRDPSDTLLGSVDQQQITALQLSDGYDSRASLARR